MHYINILKYDDMEEEDMTNEELNELMKRKHIMRLSSLHEQIGKILEEHGDAGVLGLNPLYGSSRDVKGVAYLLDLIDLDLFEKKKMYEDSKEYPIKYWTDK